MPYDLTITTKDGVIQKEIQELKDMREELIKFENNNWVQVDLKKVKTIGGKKCIK